MFSSFFVTGICCFVSFWRQNVGQTCLGCPPSRRPVGRASPTRGPGTASPTPTLGTSLPAFTTLVISCLQARRQETKKVQTTQSFQPSALVDRPLPNASCQSFLDMGADPSNAGARNTTPFQRDVSTGPRQWSSQDSPAWLTGADSVGREGWEGHSGPRCSCWDTRPQLMPTGTPRSDRCDLDRPRSQVRNRVP